jgi:hypothetical protein
VVGRPAEQRDDLVVGDLPVTQARAGDAYDLLVSIVVLERRYRNL